eukprot:1158314-Pelagomonas_calceolata.AAC.17
MVDKKELAWPPGESLSSGASKAPSKAKSANAASKVCAWGCVGTRQGKECCSKSVFNNGKRSPPFAPISSFKERLLEARRVVAD